MATFVFSLKAHVSFIYYAQMSQNLIATFFSSRGHLLNFSKLKLAGQELESAKKQHSFEKWIVAELASESDTLVQHTNTITTT